MKRTLAEGIKSLQRGMNRIFKEENFVLKIARNVIEWEEL